MGMADSEDIMETLISMGVSEEQLQEEIKAKIREYQNFISTNGALFLVAKEHGLQVGGPNLDSELGSEPEEEMDYDEFAVNIKDLEHGMSQLVLIGRIERVFKPKQFTRKDGTPGYVGNFFLRDKTGSVKITLWGEDVQLLESEYFVPGEPVRIIGAYSKIGYKDEMEVHIGKKGKVELAPSNIDQGKLPSEDFLSSTQVEQVLGIEGGQDGVDPIETIKIGDKNISIRATIANLFPPKQFTKKDESPGQVRNIKVKDDTGEIRITFWDEDANLLEGSNIGDVIVLDSLYARHNDYFDTVELTFGKYSKFKTIGTADSNVKSTSASANASASSQPSNELPALRALTAEPGFKPSIKGRILRMNELKHITRKDGSATWLLSFILTDEDFSIKVNIWGDIAVEFLKEFGADAMVELQNVAVKHSDFEQANIISSTRKFQWRRC